VKGKRRAGRCPVDIWFLKNARNESQKGSRKNFHAGCHSPTSRRLASDL